MTAQASMFEPNSSRAFFGTHYAKLKAIKEAYDPTDIFIIREGVRSEYWGEELRCMSR